MLIVLIMYHKFPTGNNLQVDPHGISDHESHFQVLWRLLQIFTEFCRHDSYKQVIANSSCNMPPAAQTYAFHQSTLLVILKGNEHSQNTPLWDLFESYALLLSCSLLFVNSVLYLTWPNQSGLSTYQYITTQNNVTTKTTISAFKSQLFHSGCSCQNTHTHILAHIIILQLSGFCPGQPGWAVPEETFTHSHLSWS